MTCRRPGAATPAPARLQFPFRERAQLAPGYYERRKQDYRDSPDLYDRYVLLADIEGGIPKPDCRRRINLIMKEMG